MHGLKFVEASLSRIGLGVNPGQTRVITFYAPSEEGEYGFFCAVAGHRSRGEWGMMIVK